MPEELEEDLPDELDPAWDPINEAAILAMAKILGRDGTRKALADLRESLNASGQNS